MTDRVVVLGGAGAQARECIRDLIANVPAHIIIADIAVAAAQAVADELDPSGERVTVVETDVADARSLRTAIAGARVVANFVGPYYRWGSVVAGAAIEAGVDYVDICDDDAATRTLLQLHDAAKDAQVTLLTGMGSGPGVTNVLAGICAGNLDETTHVEFDWFASGFPGTAGEAAFAHLLWGLATPVRALMAGEDVTIAPGDGQYAVTHSFPEPFGEVRVWAFPHPEPVTLRHFVPSITTAISRGAAYPTSVMRLLEHFGGLRCASDEPLLLSGREVAPAEFAVQYLLQRAHEFALPGESELPIHGSGMNITVRGRRGGDDVEFVLQATSEGSMAAETGIPAAVAIDMLFRGEVSTRGVLAGECISPRVFLDHLSRRAQRRHSSPRSGLSITCRTGGEVQPVSLRKLLNSYQSPVVTVPI